MCQSFTDLRPKREGLSDKLLHNVTLFVFTQREMGQHTIFVESGTRTVVNHKMIVGDSGTHTHPSKIFVRIWKGLNHWVPSLVDESSDYTSPLFSRISRA